MKVYFIGAGPGAADLITLRGSRLLGAAPMVLYAGSLVPAEMLSHCRPDAEIHDTAELNLDQQEALYAGGAVPPRPGRGQGRRPAALRRSGHLRRHQ
ncbi:SAM-dependent methyltransferase [Chromobacterium phragmitis]|uniref:SAM-dependent methyltransferase n=1 Tax=Chromobacterium phragmitis TaxID=2202141 RepID=UPI003877EAC4